MTHYVGGKAYEEITKPGNVVTVKHYIGDFAVVTTELSGGGGQSTDYLHRDHLGSLVAITDSLGNVAQRMSFDAWGRRREVNWQPMTDLAIAGFSTLTTTRGFTNHEMLDTVGLIHMNGRVYDPTIARFLSADPHVQAPSNFQNWNRYSYVLNNPLSLTDPTGFFFKSLFKAIGNFFRNVFRAIGSVFKQILRSPIFRAIVQIVGCNPIAVAATFGGSCAAVTAGITLAAGGSVADALKAAAFAFAQIGSFYVVG